MRVIILFKSQQREREVSLNPKNSLDSLHHCRRSILRDDGGDGIEDQGY